MAEEQKQPSRPRLTQMTLDNFEGADEADSEYGHLTAHLVDVEDRATHNN